MDTATIVLGIGVLISLVLGLINFLWGPAILARREKVTVVNSEVYPEFLSKGARVDTRLGMGPLFIKNPALSIEASCELVLTRGQKEIEVKEVELKFDRVTSDKLKAYFQIPHQNRIYLLGEPTKVNVLLPVKKSVQFSAERLFDCTEEFQTQYDKMGSGSYPEFIQPLLDKLETKYQICWTRYDGQRVCWKFPQKWWRNLGKRLWG